MPYMERETPVTRMLTELGVPHTLHIHKNPLRSLEQAASERGLEPDQIVRSLLFRLEGQRYVLVLVAGPGKVSWPKLRSALGVRRLTTAKEREVEAVTGFEPGAVSPIGLKSTLHIIADRGMLEQETISIGAGIRNAGVILLRDDLLGIIEADFADLIED